MTGLPTGWTDLPDDMAQSAWQEFGAAFAFRPSVEPRHWPGIVIPDGATTYDLAASWTRPRQWPAETPLARYDVDVDALERLVMAALRDCTPLDGSVYALDWQHAAFRCAPHLAHDSDVEEWPVSVLPNGDYHVFVDPNLQFGVFGHPWQATLTVFGADLVNSMTQRRAEALLPIYTRAP